MTMKRTFKTLAAFTAILLTAVSCQKEDTFTLPMDVTVVNEDTVVHYTVNGETLSINIPNNEAWDAFMDMMLALAREGYTVSFGRGAQVGNHLSKETVVYTTTSESDAKGWATEMNNQGYEVTISYNSKTGIYTCTAIK